MVNFRDIYIPLRFISIMYKLVIWIIAIVVVLGVFLYFNDSPDLAPKQTTQNLDSDSPDTTDIDDSFFSISATNLTINFSGTGISIPYFCQYFAYGGGGSRCHPSMSCSCTDSDNGDIPCVFGIVNWTVNQTNYIYKDFCRDNMTLDEYHCGYNGTVQGTTYRCPRGCSNGVCL